MSDPHTVHGRGSAHPLPSDPPLPAKVGRYEVVRLLGEGAMGRVLLAHDPVLDRDVAVKYLRGDLKIPRDVRRGLLERMEHEARASARVAHPNLVVLHDMGEDPAVGLYLVFEYVEGPTLKQRLRDGRLPPIEAARLARELGAALTTAHAAGILHRDVKPENIMLAKTGGKIADFGIARIPDSTLTHQGGLMGTPAYSAPETFRGGKFSPRSDQFSLAASIYEALSGERAFPGDDAVTVAARIASELPEPFAAALGLSPAVDAALSRALDRAPEARFADCEAFAAALSQSVAPPAVEGAAVGSTGSAAAGTPAAYPHPERRNGQVILGALLVVATAALVARTALRSAESAPAPAPEPAVSVAEAPAPAVSVVRHRPTAPSVSHSSRPRGESSAVPGAMAEPSGRPAEPAATANPGVSDAGARAVEPATSALPAVPGVGSGAPRGAPAAPRPATDPR